MRKTDDQVWQTRRPGEDPHAKAVFVIMAARAVRGGREQWIEALFLDWDNAHRFIVDGLHAVSCSPNPLITKDERFDSAACWELKEGTIFNRTRIEYQIIERFIVDWPAVYGELCRETTQDHDGEQRCVLPLYHRLGVHATENGIVWRPGIGPS